MNKATDVGHSIKDESNDQRYFVMTPQIVWALARNPHDYMLWDTIKLIAGEHGVCKLGTRDLAQLARMSVGKVSDSRAYLLANGLLVGGKIKDPGYDNEVWNLTVPDLWERTIIWRKMLDSAVPGHHIIAKLAWAAEFSAKMKNLGFSKSIKVLSEDVAEAIRRVGVTVLGCVQSAYTDYLGGVHNMNTPVQDMNTHGGGVHNMNTLDATLLVQSQGRGCSQYEPITRTYMNRISISEIDSNLNDESKESCSSSTKDIDSGRKDGQKVEINFDLEPYNHDGLGASWVWVNHLKVTNPTGADLVKAYCAGITPKRIRIVLPDVNDPILYKAEFVFVENGLGSEQLYPVIINPKATDPVLTPNQKDIKDALIEIMPLSGLETNGETKAFMKRIQTLAINADGIGHTGGTFRNFRKYYYEIVRGWLSDVESHSSPITEKIIKRHFPEFIRWRKAGGTFDDGGGPAQTTVIENGQLPEIDETTLELQRAWGDVAECLGTKMTPAQFRQLFGAAQVLERDGDKLTVALPDEKAQEWIGEGGRLHERVQEGVTMSDYQVSWVFGGE